MISLYLYSGYNVSCHRKKTLFAIAVSSVCYHSCLVLFCLYTVAVLVRSTVGRIQIFIFHLAHSDELFAVM